MHWKGKEFTRQMDAHAFLSLSSSLLHAFLPRNQGTEIDLSAESAESSSLENVRCPKRRRTRFEGEHPIWMFNSQALHNLRGFCSSTQVESATEALSALFSTLFMTIEIVLRIHSLIFYVVVSFQQKIIDVQRKQDERIENLEEDNGSFKAMLKEMQEQTREMKRHTVETRQADALAREVMKEAYDKQINMLQETLSAIVERKAV